MGRCRDYFVGEIGQDDLFNQARMIATPSPGEEKEFHSLFLMFQVSMSPVKKFTCLAEIFLSLPVYTQLYKIT